jgi:hypothetical protein
MPSGAPLTGSWTASLSLASWLLRRQPQLVRKKEGSASKLAEH